MLGSVKRFEKTGRPSGGSKVTAVSEAMPIMADDASGMCGLRGS